MITLLSKNYLSPVKCIFLITYFILASFLIVGCGASSIVIKPNYNHKELVKCDSCKNIKITDILDNREIKENVIGTAKVGLFNKTVPYKLDGELELFIKEAINKIIVNENIDTEFLPIKVEINEFNVYEKTGMFSEIGNFDCQLKFIYPINDAELASIQTETHQEFSGMDVTNSLEGLIYKGVVDCVDKFITEYNAQKSEYFVNSQDSSFNFEAEFSENIIATESVVAVKKKPKNSINLGVVYLKGKNLDYGVNLLYQGFDSLKTNLTGGFGYSIQYLKIKDTDLISKAFFFNYGFRYALRYYLSKENNGLYFGGALKLLFGSEKITYYDGEDSHFFFGPTFEEVIGFSINNNVMFELGSYQIKLFGSDLLPDDIGFSLGLIFGF